MQNDTSTLPELNLRVIVLGLALSVIMGSANVYLGLKAVAPCAAPDMSCADES